jgi:NitT/TauT family transport system permease protein
MAVTPQERRVPWQFAGAAPHTRHWHLPGRLRAGLSSLAAIVLLLAVWELATALGWASQYVLPAPAIVLADLWEIVADGTITSNAAVTLQEAGLGLLIAAAVALPCGYVIAHVRFLEQFVAPLIAASQAVPAVAVAPLLVTSIGNGVELKVVVCAIIVVFPLLVNAVTAFRGVPREYLEVARVFGVPRWETIARVEAPLAAPVLLAGVKLAVTLSLTGAIVGEFVASGQGLGFLLNFYRDNQLQPYAFATLVVLMAIGIAAYSCISFLERKVAGWQG